MLTFLFWNLNKKPLQELVAELVVLHEVDVLILAECRVASPRILAELNSKRGPRFSLAASPSDRIVIYTRFPSELMTPISDVGGLSIRHLVHPTQKGGLLIAAAHLASRLHQTEDDLNFLSTRLRSQIEDAEREVGHNRTVIVGDLNMNPFDPGVVSSEGLHSVMDKRIAQGEGRTVKGAERRFFYNPMWSRFGDESLGPPGTYYYDSTSRPVNHFWHIFDQVLIRPELLPNFRHEELQIITEIHSHSLMSANGRPDTSVASDHFPLRFRLNF